MSQISQRLLAYPKTSWVLGCLQGECGCGHGLSYRASCLHLNTQVGPVTGLSKGVTQFIVVGYCRTHGTN